MPRPALLLIISVLMVGAAFANPMGSPKRTMDLVRNRAVELCPEAYSTLKSFYASNPEIILTGRVNGLWEPPAPEFDTWYVDAFLAATMMFREIPDAALQGMAWVTVSSDLVMFPISIGEVFRQIHMAGPDKDLAPMQSELEIQLHGLRATLALSECLYPDEAVLMQIEEIKASMASSLRMAVEALECNKWYHLSHEILRVSENVEQQKLYSEFTSLLSSTVGECQKDE